MTRPLEDWTDRKYEPGAVVSHAIAFGDQYALCGAAALTEW